MERIGFLGLGTMGSRMAGHLLDAGYEVTVFDLQPAAVEAMVEAGATAADSPEEVARASDIVLLSLPGPDEVVAVVEQLESGFQEGSVLVDLTTSLPSTTNAVAEELAGLGVEVLGAPVSGGRSGAEAGTLACMVGGDEAVFERCEPVFEEFSGNVVHVGETPGHGHAMKLVNNYLSFVAMICTSEAIIIGQTVGLEMETMLDVLNSGSARNTATSLKFPEYIVPETYDMEYNMGLVEKDMGLLVEVTENEHLPFMVGGTIRQVIAYIRSELGSEADYTEMYKYFHRVMAEAKQ
jgi:3-hydroxyisobutyrate dehydrogenase-like beta-hydroxyacid dehydrogenase